MRRVTAVMLLACVAGPGLAEPIKSDEQVVLFPTLGASSDGGRTWTLNVHGWIFEEGWRDRDLDFLGKLFDIDERISDPRQQARLKERARLFLVDNEGGKEVEVTVGDLRFRLGASETNGHFRGTFTLSAEAVLRLGKREQLTSVVISLKVLTTSKDNREISGEVRLLDQRGLSVISDIDDTIRITGVGNKKVLLKSTFLEPFKAVKGMPELYRHWAERYGAAFHYASASPWQLYVPLAAFIDEVGYPRGSFHLKPVRLKDRTLLALFDSPLEYKPGIIEPLLRAFPDRSFVLVGDSSESDPEIFGKLARQYGAQVRAIFIRDLSRETDASARYAEAFRDLPPGLWRVFKDPAEMMDALDVPATSTAPE